MALTWQQVSRDPRFAGLAPEEQARVRQKFEERYAPAAAIGHAAGPDEEAAVAPSDWVERLDPDADKVLGDQLRALPMEERQRQVGIATGRLTEAPDGSVQPRAQGPEPTMRERLMARMAPAFRHGARILDSPQGYIADQMGVPIPEDVRHPVAAVADATGDAARDALSFAPEGVRNFVGGLAQAGVELAPFATELGPSAFGGKVAGGVERLAARVGADPRAAALIARLTGAGIRSTEVGGRVGAVEAGRAATEAIADNRSDEAADRAGEAFRSGFVGGAVGHGVIGEVGVPVAQRIMDRIGAGRTDVAAAVQGVGTPKGDAVAATPAVPVEAPVEGTPGTPISSLRDKVLGNGVETPTTIPDPSRAPTPSQATPGQPYPPEAEEALTLAAQASRDGHEDEASMWREVADEFTASYRRAFPPTTDFVAGEQGVQPPRPGDLTQPVTQFPRPTPAMAGQPIAGYERGMSLPPRGGVPALRNELGQRGGLGAEVSPAQERLRRLVLGERAPMLPALPEQRADHLNILEQARRATATPGEDLAPVYEGEIVPTPERRALPAPAMDVEGVEPGTAVVPAAPTYPGAAVPRGLPPPAAVPGLPQSDIRDVLAYTRRLRGGGAPARPTEAPPAPAAGGARLPQEVEDVVAGRARAWLRPAAAEGTVPTAGEQSMQGVDLARFARERGLGLFHGRDGTEVLYNPSAVKPDALRLLDRLGRLPDVVNGLGTSPKPAAPTTAVTARDAAGNEVRTVLTDRPETTQAAVEAQPPSTSVEVKPAAAAVPEVLAGRPNERNEGNEKRSPAPAPEPPPIPNPTPERLRLADEIMSDLAAAEEHYRRKKTATRLKRVEGLKEDWRAEFGPLPDDEPLPVSPPQSENGKRAAGDNQPEPRQPAPAAAEPALSPEYEEALADSRKAEQAYDPVVEAYRARRIGDDEYLAARRARDAAREKFDAAYAKEQARGEASEKTPETTPSPANGTRDPLADQRAAAKQLLGESTVEAHRRDFIADRIDKAASAKGLRDIADSIRREHARLVKAATPREPVVEPGERLPLGEQRGTLPDAAPAKPGLVGTETRASTPKFPEVKARWEAVELGDLVASHSVPDFAENPRFPREFQPRDRSKPAAQDQVRKNATRLDPEQMGESPTAAHGAPVIGPDNLVESGNGRVMALDLARSYRDEGRYGAYRRWLSDHAEEFGLDPKAVDAMDAPVLVRRRVGELDAAARRDYAKDANEDTVLAMSRGERARNDADVLTPDVLDKLNIPESGDILAASNRAFVDAFKQKAVGTTAAGDFYTSGGDVSQAGALRMRDALLAKIFDDPSTRDLLERFTESTDDNVKNVTGAILDAAGPLAKMKGDIKAGHLFDRDLTAALAQAAEKISGLRNEGTALGDWLKQHDMFGRDPVVEKLVRAVDEFGRSRKRLAQVFKDYADVLREYGDPQGPKLPGQRSLEEPGNVGTLLDEATRRTREEYGGQTLLLGAMRQSPKKQLADAVATLEAQYRSARDAGDHGLADLYKAQLDFVKKTGKPPIAGASGTLGDRLGQVLREAGIKTDDRITERLLDDAPQISTYLGTSGFVVRKYHPFRRMVQRLVKAIDEGDLNHRFLLERDVRYNRDGRAVSGGWRKVSEMVPAGEREAFTRAAFAGDAAERILTPEELRTDYGLSEPSVQAFKLMHQQFDYALQHIVNPLRAAEDKAPLVGRTGYLPHRWFGSYDVHVNGERVPGSWATKAEAYRAATAILKSGELADDANLQIVPRFREFLSEMPDVAESRALAALVTRLEKYGTIAKEDILDAYRAGVEPRGFGRHMERRKGVAGFETDRLFGEQGIVDRYFSELSRWAPMRQATKDVKLLLATTLGANGQPTQPHLYEYMNRLVGRAQGKAGWAEITADDLLRRAPILGRYISPVRPTMKAVRLTRNVVSHLKLGLGNLSAGIVNAAQFITHATPVLGAEYAAKGAYKFLVPDKEAAGLLMRFRAKGLIEPMFIRGEAAGSGGRLGRILEKSFFPMTVAEHFNRGATLLGAYYRARDLGMAGDRIVRFTSDFARENLADIQKRTLIDTARKVSDLVNFRYDLVSRPAVTTGPVGELVGQFKTFSISTLELQRRLIDMAAKGDVTPVMMHYGSLLALSGVLGFPFFGLMDQIVRLASGGDKSPLDYVTDHVHPAVSRGAPALIGVDVSRRVGMGDVTPQNAQDILGPAASTLISAMTFLRDHDASAVGRGIAPGPASFFQAWREYQDGFASEPNERKRARFTPSGWDTLYRAVGFQPTSQSDLQDAVRSVRRTNEQFKKHKAEFIDDAVAARQAGDHSRVFDVIREAQHAGVPIQFKDVLHEEQQKKLTTVERLRKQVPKPLRPTVYPRLQAEDVKERLRRRIMGVR